MGTKHTPTPWKVDDLEIQPIDNKFFTIANVRGFDLHEARANAALIVHRVNLFEELVEQVERFKHRMVQGSCLQSDVDFLDNLLKRARGES